MRADFRLEDWTVRPLRDCIERGDEVVHIHPKPMAVLEALAAAGGEVVTREELFEKVWPGTIVTDDALTQCIVELRKAFGDSAQEARVIKTIPKVGFCLVTPITFLDDEAQDDGQRHRFWEGRSLILGVFLIAVAGALLVLAGQRFRGAPVEPGTAKPVSIAVLPFADLSETGDQQWFTDGLSEELINMLARIDGLQVTNRTSSFHFRDPDEDLRLIADTLGVSHVLEGSVRRDGEQLRVTAQLIDAGSGYHLWSEAYDRELENVLVLQQDISMAVIGALLESLGSQLGAVPGVAEVINNEAHDAVLMGRHLVARRTLEDVQAAMGEFEKAIAIEPDYALAHAELATAIRLFWNLGGDIGRLEAIKRAKAHAEEALELDPGLAEAWAAAAWVQDTVEGRIEFNRKAIDANPSYAYAYVWLGRDLYYAGRYKESFEALEKAISLDPLSIPGLGNYVSALIFRGRLDEARRQVDKLSRLNPGLYLRLSAVLAGLGGNESAYALGTLDALLVDPDRSSYWNYLEESLARMNLAAEAFSIQESTRWGTLLLLGQHDEAMSDFEQRITENPDQLARASIKARYGLTLAAAGDYDHAGPLLNEAWQSSDGKINAQGAFRPGQAMALIQILRAASEEEKVSELLAAMRDYVNRRKEAGITFTTHSTSVDYIEGITAYLSGQRETGISLIARAVDDGKFLLLWQAYLQPLYDDPNFAPIKAKQLERQAQEREKFLAVVCNNNPYSEVWQPEESTCEQFLAESATRQSAAISSFPR